MTRELFGAASVLLARIDDTDYLAVRAVYAVTGDDPPSWYVAYRWAEGVDHV